MLRRPLFLAAAWGSSTTSTSIEGFCPISGPSSASRSTPPGESTTPTARCWTALEIGSTGLGLIQEGLRGVVRLPEGTAHALAGRDFPIPVMGKTGTTSEFRDALFVGDKETGQYLLARQPAPRTDDLDQRSPVETKDAD